MLVGREVDGLLWAVRGLFSGPMLTVLGRSWDLCWRSWAALGAYVGGLGSGSGPKLAVLACLGAKVVGLGSGSGPKLTVLACLGAKAVGLGRGSGRKVALARAGKRSGQEIRPKSGPNPSGSKVRKRSGPPNRRRRHRPHRPPQAIFQLIYLKHDFLKI